MVIVLELIKFSRILTLVMGSSTITLFKVAKMSNLLLFWMDETIVPEYIEKMRKFYSKNNVKRICRSSAPTGVAVIEPRAIPPYDDLGRKFLADMINRVGFVLVSLITTTLIISFAISVTISRIYQKGEIEFFKN